MDKELLKEYLCKQYQGWQSFLDNVVFPIFGEDDFEDGYAAELLESQPERTHLAETTGIRSIKQVGKIYVGVEPLQIFDVTVSDRVMMERNRVNIQRLIRSVMDQFSCAFMLFHYDDDTRWDWRFTFCRKSGNKEESTDSKRYTFLLGPGQSCRTARDNFFALYERRDSLEIKDIEDAFNVEKLSKEFFGKYKAQYELFVNYMVNPINGMRDDYIYTDFDHTGLTKAQIKEREEKPIRDYVKKLLGRIVFLHFLQKKGWLGVPAGEEWGQGDHDLMLHLFENASKVQKADFLDKVLEPLFADALDKNRASQGDAFDTGVEGFRNIRIPYLNGGLFERDELDMKPSHFPADYFNNLLTMLSQYNFTIDENDPDDAEVGVDPEMLGRIFENLLEDNKDKGAYYTPKEIVQYMCRESLIAYLQTDVEDEATKEAIRQFVTTHNTSVLGANDKFIKQLDEALCNVKICDPAIGSGAFPMGLLRELFFCRSAIEPNTVERASEIKRHIIQNNIYGVDIERGAVEIARLRFWLSLIVDEKSPCTLPNLDFKIMQGNSLLEQYKGVDLSTMTEKKIDETGMFTIFDNMLDLSRMNLRKMLDEYYCCSNHNEKQSLRQRIIDNVQQQLREQSINIDFGELDLSGNDQFMLWHTWFYDVFSHGGFDIVIGNPPYVEAKKLKYIASTLKDQYEVYSGTADLSVYFVELGFNTLSANGTLSFITTNKFFNTGYGLKLRKLLSSNLIHKIINFEQVEVFKDILVSSVIIEFAKHELEKGHTFTYEKFYKLNKEQFILAFVNRQNSFGTYSQDYLNEQEWSFSNMAELQLKKHIENGSKHLSDWEGVSIYRGVTTGFNPAFIINDDTKKELLNEDPNNIDVIKNMLQGRNIRKWYYNESDDYLLQTGYDIDIRDKYPSIFAYQVQYEDELSVRADQGKDWWNLRACKYYPEFEKPEKIIWGLTADKWAFTIDTEQHYLPSNGYILTSTKIPIKYILGLLNSKLMHYYFHFIGIMTAGGAYTLKAATISALPFKIAKNTDDVVEIVERILLAKAKDHDADVATLESEIDQLVYQLYGLTEDEIKIVEQSSN